MPTSSTTSHQHQPDLGQAQRHGGWPWPRKWNWLLEKPHGVGVGGRWYVPVALLFSGTFGLLRLTPMFGPQTETLGLIVNGLGAALIPIGCAWAWSALRLHQFHNTAPA